MRRLQTGLGIMEARMTNGRRGFLLQSVALAAVWCLSIAPVQAATVYLDSEGLHGPGDTFLIPIRIDTEGDCINAVDVSLQYDTDLLTAVDLGRGQSIITLWTQRPTIDKEAGTVSFSGGVPGGYCGRVIGDPGLTNILGYLVVQVNNLTNETTYAQVQISRAQVLQNDGRGTPLPTTIRGATVELSATSSQGVNEWLDIVRGDTVAPELFEIVLHTEPSIERGKYYIIFTTVDKQSGIDHYEVLETDPNRFGFLTWAFRKSHWIVAESPYILRDQSLRSTIMVKAVDKAGNERIVTYKPPESLIKKPFLGDLIGIILLIGIIVILYLLYRITRRKHREAQIRTSEDANNEPPYDDAR